MRVTRAIARTALAYLAESNGSADAAAYQCTVALRALGPYTCSHTWAVRDVLRKLTPDRPDRLLAVQLTAEGLPVERYATADGVIRFRAAERIV
jgi:hypothetical protein